MKQLNEDVKNTLTDKQLVLYKHLVEEEQLNTDEVLEFVKSIEDGTDINRLECPLVNDCGNREFTVLTDDEADVETREYYESLVDDMLYNVEDWIRKYIDEDKMVEDMIWENGRGNALNSWDGQEFVYEVNGTEYFVYKN